MSITEKLNGHAVKIPVAIIAALLGTLGTFILMWFTKLNDLELKAVRLDAVQREYAGHTAEDHGRFEAATVEIRGSIREIDDKLDRLKEQVDTRLPR